jgi:hypothetical protein
MYSGTWRKSWSEKDRKKKADLNRLDLKDFLETLILDLGKKEKGSL